MAERVSVLLTEEAVDARIKEIGEQVTKDYAGKEVHLICVLKGGVFFMCELAKRIEVPVSMDFMAISSYGADTKSSGVIKIVKDLDESITGKDVLVVDDMIASGDSMLDIAYDLKKRGANRVFAACTYALFTEGIDRFNKAVEDGVLGGVLSTNLTYRRPELKAAPWFFEADVSKYIAYSAAWFKQEIVFGASFFFA